jgi:hypothetical protein
MAAPARILAKARVAARSLNPRTTSKNQPLR